LAVALSRAKQLYEKEGRNTIPVAAAAADWSYSEKSSSVRSLVASLKQFGLLEEESSRAGREIQLSRLAFEIILDERENSADRDRAIQRAALMPAVHEDLWSRYEGSLPSDATLRHYLLLERGFNDAAATEFIRQFRETVAFADLSRADVGQPHREGEPQHTVPQSDQGAADLRGGVAVVTAPHHGSTQGSSEDQRTVVLPMAGNSWISLTGAFPISEAAWVQMLAVLDAMKPGLVETAPDASPLPRGGVAEHGDEATQP
jgi:hypothetical protein